MRDRWTPAARTAAILVSVLLGLAALVVAAGSAREATASPTQVTTPVTGSRPTITIRSTTSATTRPAASTTVATGVTTAPTVVPTTAARFVSPTFGGVARTTVPVPATAAPTTTTTSTTIAGINGQVPPGLVTVPLETRASNGHVDPLFAWMSAGGFALALLIVLGRLFVTRRGGLDRSPYRSDMDPASRRA